MIEFANLLGKLNWSALPHDPITAGGAATVVGGVVAVMAALTYFKRWKWLWKEWLTSLDPKRIGVMYIVVAVVMLVRAGVDALMIRAQQAISVGNNHGFLSGNHFQQVF